MSEDNRISAHFSVVGNKGSKGAAKVQQMHSEGSGWALKSHMYLSYASRSYKGRDVMVVLWSVLMMSVNLTVLKMQLLWR